MRQIFPILLGVVGVAILVGLGVWQVQRLAWKEDVIARIEAAVVFEAGPIPEAPDPERDAYLAVGVGGFITGDELYVLAGTTPEGPEYRVIGVLATAGDEGPRSRRVLVDLGIGTADRRGAPRTADTLYVIGNLHWPDEVDSWTPPQPDTSGLWYGRDIAAMAAALDAEPVLVVVRALMGPQVGTRLTPLDTASIKNDHLNYAITWFLLAAVWAAMSVALVVRSRKAA